MQIVGNDCTKCGTKIDFAIDADWCPDCQSCFHIKCNENAEYCPNCGNNLGEAKIKENDRRARDPNSIINGKDLSFCCINCGSTNVEDVRLVKLSCAPMWVKYLFATGVLALPFYLLLRKTANLKIGLCKVHKKKLAFFNLLGLAVILFAPTAIYFGLNMNLIWLQVLGLFALIYSVIIIRLTTPVVVKSISGNHIKLHDKHNKALQRTCR